MADQAAWQPIDDGATLGQEGSEGGIILRDDEYRGGARITLESGGGIAPFSITCGVYGWVVHTRFFATLDEAEGDYAPMQRDLSAIVELLPTEADLAGPAADAITDGAVEAIDRFLERFP